MSVRSELRMSALDRDGYRCQWPNCDVTLSSGGTLEMCHLIQLSQGGPDTLDNVVMLCRFHHGVLDNRVQNGRRQAIMDLFVAYLATANRTMP